MAGELDALIDRFMARRGLARSKPDQEGRYFFVFDGELELNLLQTGDQIIVQGEIKALPEDEHLAAGLLANSLQKNLRRLRDKEEVLSIDPQDGTLMMFRRLSARRLDITDLERALGEFANAMEFWNRTMSDSPQVNAPPPPMHMLFP